MAVQGHLFARFQPQHYQLFLDIDRQHKLIQGRTLIQGQATSAKIAVHQKGLQIQAVEADGQAVTFSVSEAQEQVAIALPAAGPVSLTLVYQAPLTDTMMGIYPSYYQVDGQRKQLIGTQFETTAARQAFPCVDEPEAKATFELAVRFDEQPGEVIIANMPEVKVVDGWHHFAATKVMSTYLVAFAFGELQSALTTTKSGVEIGVFATKAHKPAALDFALDIAKRSIEFFEDFYQTPYPLPHSYQLALPDFSAGAMENWGLVTYREAYLTVDPANTSLAMKQRVATVIAHELAHQWFGDLVTMKWWDDLWLNESFANMMEYVAIDALQPDWHIWENFQTAEAAMALRRDATDGVQSVHVQVEDPGEIDALFDGAIVYAKGARLLVMVRALIGDDALRQGLKAYFAKHQYANATGADLWAALGAASGLDIEAVMTSWLEQPGYPVLHAGVENGRVILRQQQFFIGEHQPANRLWQLPLNANFKAPQLMTTAELDLGDYAVLKTDTALRLNVGNNAHYIVAYDEVLQADLMAEVDGLDAIAQLQLLQDLRLLAEGGLRDYADVVPLLANFATSHSHIVNAALYALANALKKFTQPGTASEANLRQLFATLCAGNLARLGWQPQAGDSYDDAMSRPHVLAAALYAKLPEALAAAHAAFQAAADPAALPADTRVYLLQNESQNYSDAATFERLLADYQASHDGNYKRDLAAALVKTPESKQLAKLVAAFEDATIIKPQDLRAWFAGVLANPAGQQLAWDWLRQRWSWLEATVGGDMEFPTYINVIAQVFDTQARLAEFMDFFRPLRTQSGLVREIDMDQKVIASRVALINQAAAGVNAAVAATIAG